MQKTETLQRFYFFAAMALTSSKVSLNDCAIISAEISFARRFFELYPLSRTHKKKGLKNPKKIFKYQLDFLSLEDRYQ